MDDKAFIEKIEKTLQDAILNVKPETTVTTRRMFGGAGYYADDRMFAAWFRNDTLGLKLSDEDGEALLQNEGAKKAVMGTYFEVPATWLDNLDALLPWVKRSLDYTATLPPKKKKSKK